jgi:transcriptional regulator with XRE-family HTH domain
MEIHEKIRLLREAKHWSQEDMAEKLNMSISGYSKIERGVTKSHVLKMEQIAKIFEVDLFELIPLDGGNIYLNSNHANNDNHIIGSPSELAFEVQKQQLIIELKDKELAMKDREIAYLKELLDMHKKPKNNATE